MFKQLKLLYKKTFRAKVSFSVQHWMWFLFLRITFLMINYVNSKNHLTRRMTWFIPINNHKFFKWKSHSNWSVNTAAKHFHFCLSVIFVFFLSVKCTEIKSHMLIQIEREIHNLTVKTRQYGAFCWHLYCLHYFCIDYGCKRWFCNRQ